MALRQLILWTALLAPTAPALAADKPVDPRCGTTLERGFVDVYRDADSGRVLIGVHQLDTPFLLVTSLPGGLGSNDVGLDRGQVGRQQMAHFRRVGGRLLLVADNTRFVADSADEDERRAATDAFAPSVLWAGSILARPPKPGCKAHWKTRDDDALLFDAGSLLTADLHGIAPAMGGGPGIAGALKAAGQGDYALDPARSAVLPEAARSFPDNSEFEALLTFAGEGAGEFVNQVAVDASALSLRQHLSFVRLPPPGYVPRAYHPASGGFSIGQFDFAQPLGASLDVRRQVRFRLELDAAGKVVKPIVFHLDRGTPEPVRAALLDGARWWSRAFDEAGFPGGFHVELMPEGADPMDIRYNTITWTHRATRGWSYGLVITDPRTGEIIKGAVNLGSQRVRQDILIAEALLAPYDKPDADARREEALKMALARLRQLSAHEVGHTLGFNHNFAASRTGNGSVMDYPHPLIALDERGTPRLADAYGVGVGDWDLYLVRHAYADLDDAGLSQLRAQIAQAGFEYADDADARGVGDAHAAGATWDLAGMDALAGFDRIAEARAHALAHFTRGVVPPARQHGELEARLVPVYLLHRYQVDALAHLLGGVRYRHAQAGDGLTGTEMVDAAAQRAARDRLLGTLSAQFLAIPPAVLDLLSPPGADYRRDREYFAGRAGQPFDPLAAADAAATLTLQALLAPPRLHRLALQHARDPAQPGLRESLDALLTATWKAPAASDARMRQIQRSVAWVTLDALLATHNGGAPVPDAKLALHPVVAADVRAALVALQAWAQARAGEDADCAAASDRIARFLADPASVPLRPLPPAPPGAPI
ncbi:MAG: zinc-dependent metalloprotease [Rhodanobacteraceae bacterium]|nr:zinc-dependent metalloprotease [Rhodanobacteraceae bacterium]